MTLYRRRICYKSFLIISIAVILVINVLPRISREITTAMFYFIILPAILITSLIKIPPNREQTS